MKKTLKEVRMTHNFFSKHPKGRYNEDDFLKMQTVAFMQ